jgi:hypothetical protein
VPVVGVAWNGSADAMDAFRVRHGLTFPTAIDGTGALFARFNVPVQPAWVFVDGRGQARRVLGELGPTALAARLEALARS